MKKVENIYLEKFKEWLIIKGFTSETVKGLLKTVNYFINWIEEENIENTEKHNITSLFMFSNEQN